MNVISSVGLLVRLAEVYTRIGSVAAELFLDAEQLVVLGQAFGAARSARLDLQAKWQGARTTGCISNTAARASVDGLGLGGEGG